MSPLTIQQILPAAAQRPEVLGEAGVDAGAWHRRIAKGPEVIISVVETGGRRHKHIYIVGHARDIAVRVAARHRQHRLHRAGPGGPRQRRCALRQVGVREPASEFGHSSAVRLQTGAATTATAAGYTRPRPKDHFAILVQVSAKTLVRAGEAVRLLLAQRVPPQQLRVRPVLGRRFQQRIQNRRSSRELLGGQRGLAQTHGC